MVSIVQDPLTSSENVIDNDNNSKEETINQTETEAQVAPLSEENNKEDIKITEQATHSNETESNQQPTAIQADESNLIDASAIEPVGGLDLAKPTPAKAELVTTRSENFNNLNVEEVASKNLRKTRINNDDDPKKMTEKPFIKRDDELCKN
jgi:hypothetical protein